MAIVFFLYEHTLVPCTKFHFPVLNFVEIIPLTYTKLRRRQVENHFFSFGIDET